LAGLDDAAVAFHHFDRRFAEYLDADPSVDDEQPLRSAVRVPVGPRAGRELDAVDVDLCPGRRFISADGRADNLTRKRLSVAALLFGQCRSENFHCATISGLSELEQTSHSERCPIPTRQ